MHDVVPVLTRAGCNAGTCHGTPTGKNGFRLSLRGKGLSTVLVDSVDQHITEAEEMGVVDNVVDAANTRAVFVWGPERVRIEYVEHKPEFALT